jgi:hypothetical protein
MNEREFSHWLQRTLDHEPVPLELRQWVEAGARPRPVAARVVGTGALTLAILVLGAAIFGVRAVHVGTSVPTSYRIATAQPEPKLQTKLNGQLSAQANGDGSACLSVIFGQSRTAILLPPGFMARGNPIAVYDAKGARFAIAGQQVTVGGGLVVSSQRRQVPGCPGISQSIVAGPMKTPPVAIPGAQAYNDVQVGDMQQMVSAYPSVFAGLWGDPATHVVTISIAPSADKKEAAALTARILSVAPRVQMPGHWRVGFVTAGPSLAELELIRSRVTTAQPWASVVGNHLVGWGIDPVHHAVNVMVDLITPTISSEASSEFGGLVILETADRPHIL